MKDSTANVLIAAAMFVAFLAILVAGTWTFWFMETQKTERARIEAQRPAAEAKP